MAFARRVPRTAAGQGELRTLCDNRRSEASKSLVNVKEHADCLTGKKHEPAGIGQWLRQERVFAATACTQITALEIGVDRTCEVFADAF
jgi:hypothetical protein